MKLHLGNQTLKSTKTAQCFSEIPKPKNEKLKIKVNKTGTYISGWFLFFLFSPLSFHFICVIWSCCCNHFINSHIRQQNFLQHPSSNQVFCSTLTMEWMESRESCHFYAQWFCFEMCSQNLNVATLIYFFYFENAFPHQYQHICMEASSLLIQDWYHENTPVIRVCRDTDHAKYWCAPLQVWLCRSLACPWRICILSQKKIYVSALLQEKLWAFPPFFLKCWHVAVQSTLNIASD